MLQGFDDLEECCIIYVKVCTFDQLKEAKSPC